MSNLIFSGIQPSGELHIGNYLGAVKNWVALQSQMSAVYCIVDMHAITQSYEVPAMRRRTLDMAKGLLACGVDPEQCILFVQSDVPEHTELAWIFSTVTPLGDLNRMTQFKDKSSKTKNVNLGLFAYPVLQVADICLYKATKVPVGEDQVQHLELTREVVRHFNRRYGEVFPEPEVLLSETPRVLGLDGESKMSKSMGNTIGLFDDQKTIDKALRSAKTDTRRVKRDDPGEPNDCNIFSLHKIFTDQGRQNELAEGCRTASIGCFDCKKVLQDNIMAELNPIRERWEQLDDKQVEDTLAQGAKKARAIAQETLKEVAQAMGISRKI